jgi:cyclophilin family peptidyl-prolyl cis-trans isomerase
MIYLVKKYLFLRPEGKDHEPGSIVARICVPLLFVTTILSLFIIFMGYSSGQSPWNISMHDVFQHPVSFASSADRIAPDQKIIPETITARKLDKEVEILRQMHNIEKEESSQESALHPGCLTTIPMIDRGPHIVPPPEGHVTLVCCQTTKGVLNIAVHPTWAPIGAANFLNMVRTKFFSSEVGLFRAIENFLIQFGLAGDPEVQRKYERDASGGDPYLNLQDDPQWLPRGPPGRNIEGVPRFQKGYLSYAGGGPNTRGSLT